MCIWPSAQEHPHGPRIYQSDAHAVLRHNKAFGKLSDCTPESLSEWDILAFHIYFPVPERLWILMKLDQREKSKPKGAVEETDSYYTL